MNRFFTLLISLLFVQISFAQLTVDNAAPYDDHVYLIDNVLLGGGIVASNHSYQGDSIQIAYFDGTNSNIGLNGGVVMATGDVNLLDPDFAGFGELVDVTLGVTDPDLLNVANSVPPLIGETFQVGDINDVAVLEFDFIPTSETISFRYVFGSQEYFGFENSSYNDVFGFFISGPGITGPYASPAGFPDGSVNIATFESQEANSLGVELPITISSICNYPDDFGGPSVYNPQFFVNNQDLTTVGDADGFTVVMTAEAIVQCGETYHIRLAIADANDTGLSSYVFLEEGSFSSPELNVSNSVGINSDYIEVGCGETVTLTAEPSEPGNYTYLWSNGETTESIEVGSGIYSVEVTSDVNCAIFSDEIEVVVANSVALELGPDVSVCDGLETVLTIESLEGVAPYTYSWSTGETTESITVPAGVYTLDVLDANNCPAQDQVIVSYVDRPTAELSGGGSLCTGSSIGAPLDFTFTGAPPFLVTYGNGLQQFTTTTASFNTTDALTSEGNYQILSIEDVNCTGSFSGNAVIIEYPLPTSRIDGGGVICEGDSVLVEVLVSGELPYDLYLSNGNYVTPHLGVNSHTYSFYLHNQADYSIVEIVDANDCHSIQNDGNSSILWKEKKDPQILTTIDTVLCPIHEPIELEVLTLGGTWNGNGIDYKGVFTPINAGVGEHWVSYSFPNNCYETDSMLIEVACNMQLFIPNTFTPDNNGDNDVWYIHGINVLTFDLQLFNRWGEKIFATNDIADYWTGDFQGSTVPTGTYSYIIKAYGKDGQYVTKTGIVNVLR